MPIKSQSAPADYAAALTFLFEQLPMFSRIGAVALNPSLDKIRLLCEAMGHPEKKIRSVHIAGTNGKGSTSHILAACFQEAGYKTGLYTSPHLTDIRERVRIDGALMDKTLVLEFVRTYWSVIQEIKPSYFELNVAMAFWTFARVEVDIAIIETGMGGRWDSTNVIIPEISVITNISLDHTQVLGDTIAAIAGEKAGIIKDGVPVIIGQSQDATAKVFSKYAVLNHTSLSYADRMFDAAVTSTGSHGQTIKMVDTRDYTIFEVTTDLLGSFQLDNLKTALAALVTMQELGWQVNIGHFKKAVPKVRSTTGLRGRWEVLRSSPLVIADVAHNPAGIAIIRGQLQHAELAKRKMHIILGFVADKDVTEALSLLPENAIYYFTQANVPRALSRETLKDIADERQLKGDTYPDVGTALDQALKNSDNEDLILITGSFFIVGEALAFFET